VSAFILTIFPKARLGAADGSVVTGPAVAFKSWNKESLCANA
jgi:hypothetical protein